MTLHEFPFYTTDMWDYDFQMEFAQWLHKNKKATRTCCLVGIRTQESHNRWRAIYRKTKERYANYLWSTQITEAVYNLYPIFDWKTTDIWVAMVNSSGIIIICTIFIIKQELALTDNG